ncbi:MAG: hypothetical protein R3D81_14135 [Thalassovita sp.]
MDSVTDNGIAGPIPKWAGGFAPSGYARTPRVFEIRKKPFRERDEPSEYGAGWGGLRAKR